MQKFLWSGVIFWNMPDNPEGKEGGYLEIRGFLCVLAEILMISMELIVPEN